MNANFLVIPLATLTLTSTPALAQMNHSRHGTTASQGTTRSDMGGLEKLSGKAFDRAYLSMMIAHHQGAIDMSKTVLSRLKDPQVKKWANAVITDQTWEINTMTTWLKSMGGVQADLRNRMASGMKSMITPLKTAKNPDTAFVQGMLPHHASALDMAKLALQKSKDARVLKLSRDIIKAQMDEMSAYKAWLARRG